MKARRPDAYTTEQPVEARDGRILLDANRNAYGQTSVAPYSLRAKPGAPVATPWTGRNWAHRPARAAVLTRS